MGTVKERLHYIIVPLSLICYLFLDYAFNEIYSKNNSIIMDREIREVDVLIDKYNCIKIEYEIGKRDKRFRKVQMSSLLDAIIDESIKFDNIDPRIVSFIASELENQD